MIADANDIESGSLLDCALCIVGAGAAGIALGLHYEYHQERVVILESGSWQVEQATERLNDGSVGTQGGHPPLRRYRRRVLGGATTLWGGRTVPFDPIDFAPRPWMPGAGWPIGYDAVLPYYPAAAALCEAGEFAYDSCAAFPRGMKPVFPGYCGTHFSDATIERFSCPTNFARRYGRRLHLSRNLLVLLHANAVHLQTAPDGGAVERIQVETLRGRYFALRPRRVVLAAGGLETPRLLFASHDRLASGIGNAHGQLGRCYMTHLAGTAGEIVPANGVRPNAGYEISADGIYCRRRFALTEAAQTRLETGNFIARLHHPPIPNPAHRTGAFSALYLAKSLILPEYAARLAAETPPSLRVLGRHMANLLADSPGVARLAAQMAMRRRFAARKFPSLIVAPRNGRYSVDYHAEHAPNPESRVTITRQRDVFGMPRLHVNWRASSIDVHTVRRSMAALAEDFASSGVATLRYDAGALTEQIEKSGAYGGHHIGTTRMASSPRDGVVDANCRVHGMANLFIAGSAVFPTSGQANPTLTLIALALRLGDHLQAKA